LPNPARAGVTVTLDGSDSSGAYVTSYDWTQLSGPVVTLENADTVRATFEAPPVLVPTTLTFELHITGFGGSPPSTEAETRIDVTIEPAICRGDCNDDGTVSVDEMVTGVNIALGTAMLDECPQFNCNGNGLVTVDCLVRAVNAALKGCGA
jgi:hypothetical protein